VTFISAFNCEHFEHNKREKKGEKERILEKKDILKEINECTDNTQD